jgi:hypothetical protein
MKEERREILGRRKGTSASLQHEGRFWEAVIRGWFKPICLHALRLNDAFGF